MRRVDQMKESEMVGHGRRMRRAREDYEASLPKCKECGYTIVPPPVPPTKAEVTTAYVVLGFIALMLLALIALGVWAIITQ